ncbi:MAG: hypothetical protein ACYDHY_09575 [Acidiferrobacterales bacterium]
MYQKYEVSPVVDTGGGSIASFLQYQDAAVLAGEKGKTVEMALYGIEDDGCRRHICDEGSSASMRTLLREMFGYAPDPDWAGDRIVFESPLCRATRLLQAATSEFADRKATVSESENRDYCITQLIKLGF